MKIWFFFALKKLAIEKMMITHTLTHTHVYITLYISMLETCIHKWGRKKNKLLPHKMMWHGKSTSFVCIFVKYTFRKSLINHVKYITIQWCQWFIKIKRKVRKKNTTLTIWWRYDDDPGAAADDDDNNTADAASAADVDKIVTESESNQLILRQC